MTTSFAGFSIGQIVKIQCPVYRNGKKYNGVIKSVHGDCAMVIVGNNKKATMFCNRWLTPENSCSVS